MSREGDTRSCPGKVIDTWVYEVKDVLLEKMKYNRETEENEITHERIVNKKVTVEIKMEKLTRVSKEPPHPLERVSIHAYCAELNIRIDGTDFAALKDAMWAKLDQKFAIEWERHYLVKVEKERFYGEGMGTGFTLSYDDVYKGTTHDGKVLMRRWRGSREEIETWPGTFKDDKGKVIACIIATEANREALDEFRRRIDLLREKLAEFLRPENIQLTLADLSNMRLLPAPEKEVKDAKSTKTRSGDRQDRSTA